MRYHFICYLVEDCKVLISNYLVLALIPCQNCNFFNHFPCIYVGLIVRDECERLVKTQGSKDKQVDFATSLQLFCQKFTCKKSHVWSTCLEDEELCQPGFFASVSRVRLTHKGLAKLFVWQKVMFCFDMSLPTLYITLLPTNWKECFLERKP